MNLKVRYCTKQVKVTGSPWENGRPSALFQSRGAGTTPYPWGGGSRMGAVVTPVCVARVPDEVPIA